MADSGLVDTQASQPSLALRSRHVHVLLPSVVFLGEKTVYDLLSSVPLRLVLHLLQVRGENPRNLSAELPKFYVKANKFI